MSIETIIYVVGLVLTVGALGGLAFVGVGELRVRALRRGRLAGAGANGQARTSEPLVEKSGGLFAGQVMSTVRRLGHQSAIRDPAKVSVLRSRLMQAGFHSREAPVIFLGIKAAVKRALGKDSLVGLHIALQGAGSVASGVARHAAGEGARLSIADVDGARGIQRSVHAASRLTL